MTIKSATNDELEPEIVSFNHNTYSHIGHEEFFRAKQFWVLVIFTIHDCDANDWLASYPTVKSMHTNSKGSCVSAACVIDKVHKCYKFC